MDKKDNLVRIFSGTEMLCFQLKAELEEIDVIAMIKNVFQSSLSAGFFAGSPSAIDVYINESELEMAMPIIKAFVENNPE